MSVDTFFVVSGFLLAFNFLNNEKLRQNIQESSLPSNLRRYCDYVLKRYLRWGSVYLTERFSINQWPPSFRLTPSVCVVMIGIGAVSKYLDQTSLFDIRTNVPDLQCSR